MSPARFPITIGLIAISIAIYLPLQYWNFEAIMRPLMITNYQRLGFPEIQKGQIWRLFTPMFLHFSIFHIAFNMLWMWQLGRLVEFKQGGLMLVIVCLVSAGVSNVAQYYVSGPVFGGMSGVVYALFGYVWLQGVTNKHFALKLPNNIVYFMLGWLLICWSGILEKLFDLHVANTAHTAGLASGAVLALIVTLLSRRFWLTKR